MIHDTIMSLKILFYELIVLKVLNLKTAFQNIWFLQFYTILILILNNSTIVSNIGFIRPSHNAEKERTLIQQEN